MANEDKAFTPQGAHTDEKKFIYHAMLGMTNFHDTRKHLLRTMQRKIKSLLVSGEEAAIFFAIYYFVEQKILRVSLFKAGKKLSEQLNNSGILARIDISNLRKKTDCYLLQQESMVFKSFDEGKPDLSVSDLDYKNLFRFKKLLEYYQKNELCRYEFFAHKRYKHLVYPYISAKGPVEILLATTYNNTFNDVFEQKYGRKTSGKF